MKGFVMKITTLPETLEVHTVIRPVRNWPELTKQFPTQRPAIPTAETVRKFGGYREYANNVIHGPIL